MCSFKKMHLKRTSAKCQPFCSGLNMLNMTFHFPQFQSTINSYFLANQIGDPNGLKSVRLKNILNRMRNPELPAFMAQPDSPPRTRLQPSDDEEEDHIQGPVKKKRKRTVTPRNMTNVVNRGRGRRKKLDPRTKGYLLADARMRAETLTELRKTAPIKPVRAMKPVRAAKPVRAMKPVQEVKLSESSSSESEDESSSSQSKPATRGRGRGRGGSRKWGMAASGKERDMPFWVPSQYKDCLSRYRDSHYEDKMVSRPSYFIMGIPMLVKQCLYIETHPWWLFLGLLAWCPILSQVTATHLEIGPL